MAGTVLATSRYTFRVPLASGFALFNTSSGSVLRLDGPDADELSGVLSGDRVLVEGGSLDDVLTARLRRNGFLLDVDFDELDVIRERYAAARGNAPVALLVTTTMDCNLGCYYCYESRSAEQQRIGDVDDLVAIAAQRLERRSKASLHIDWYGGEPLLNIDFLERASQALQDYCRDRQVAYHASVVSNGTRWPADVGDFVARHKLREVQISFDGLRESHDRRRRYRSGYRRADGESSFDQAAALVDELVRHTRVDVRFNADGGNADDLPGFIAFAAERGWFDGPFRCKLVVAKLSAYTERSAFLRPHELTPERFDQLQAVARELLPSDAQDDQDIVAGFPHPRTSVCGALAPDSAVVGADGLEYRCGLQVGEAHRAVGRIRTRLPIAEQPQVFPDRDWWEAFDPTTLPTCSRCSFLPVCWGGCPKRHLDGSRTDIDAEGRFWRVNLPRMIASGLDESLPDSHAFSITEQFRS
ncbi:MAG: radical SAM protein [Kineosporiaceae bacterium]